MKINQAPLFKKMTVRSFELSEARELSDAESRLMHLGFIHGATVELKKKAPFFEGPYLVEVRGRLVALTKDEAELVSVGDAV